MERLFILIAYLIGSISFAILFCKLRGLPDPRTQGSGNPGATNVLRLAGKKTAALVLILDALKGFIPVFIAVQYLNFPVIWIGFTVLAVVLGHMFPIFFGFKGGKGVATYFGALLAFSWPICLVSALVWLLVAKLSHYSSLAAIAAAIASPIVGFLLYQPYVVTPLILTSLLVIYRHKDNIVRLRNKTESKIGQKATQ